MTVDCAVWTRVRLSRGGAAAETVCNNLRPVPGPRLPGPGGRGVAMDEHRFAAIMECDRVLSGYLTGEHRERTTADRRSPGRSARPWTGTEGPSPSSSTASWGKMAAAGLVTERRNDPPLWQGVRLIHRGWIPKVSHWASDEQDQRWRESIKSSGEGFSEPIFGLDSVVPETSDRDRGDNGRNHST